MSPPRSSTPSGDCLNPPAEIDGPSFVRQLGLKLGGFSATVLAETAQAVLDVRYRDLPSSSEIERIAEIAERKCAAATSVSRPEVLSERIGPPPDLAIAAHGESFRERLRQRLGREICVSWFSDLECERLAEGVLTCTVAVEFKARWINTHFAEALTACATAEFEGVKRVAIRPHQATRRAA